MGANARYSGLTGLRGLAALAVFGVHFNQTVRLEGQWGPFDIANLLANGEHGVALFFALSGFLLAIPFWRSLDGTSKRPRLGTYAVRRIARIVPAYFVALTLLVTLAGMWRFPQTYPDIALHYLFLFNYAEFSIFSINAPFWTLAVEMQFYLLLPLLFLSLSKLPSRWRPATVLLIGTLAYALHVWLMGAVTRMVDWPLDPMLTWVRPYGAVLSHSLLAHLPHFLIGVLGAWLFLRSDSEKYTALHRSPLTNDLLFWGALALTFLLVGTAWGNNIQIPYGRYGLPLVPLLLTILLITAPRSIFARTFLESRAVRGLGTISYGVYIYHLPCQHWVDRWMMGQQQDAAERWFVFGVTSLAITVAVATTSYLLVERPALRLAHRLGRKGRAREN